MLCNTLEQLWKHIKEVVTKSAERNLGYSKKQTPKKPGSLKTWQTKWKKGRNGKNIKNRKRKENIQITEQSNEKGNG